MAFTPTAGTVAVAKDSNGTYPGINWKLNIDGKVTTNPSNFRDGRVAIGTLTDAQLTLRLIWDSADPPTKVAKYNLREKASVTVNCYVDAANYFIFPGVVSTIGPENPGIEDVVGMDVTIQLSGTITYPANG